MSFTGIKCIEGELKGAEIPMEKGQSIVIGRDAGEANLVFRDGTISRKHLLVELDKEGQFYVTDYSKVGTSFDNGDMLEHEVRTHVTTGMVFNIGNAGTKVEIV